MVDAPQRWRLREAFARSSLFELLPAAMGHRDAPLPERGNGLNRGAATASLPLKNAKTYEGVVGRFGRAREEAEAALRAKKSSPFSVSRKPQHTHADEHAAPPTRTNPHAKDIERLESVAGDISTDIQRDAPIMIVDGLRPVIRDASFSPRPETTALPAVQHLLNRLGA